jgi:hypothetical protein
MESIPPPEKLGANFHKVLAGDGLGFGCQPVCFLAELGRRGVD